MEIWHLLVIEMNVDKYHFNVRCSEAPYKFIIYFSKTETYRLFSVKLIIKLYHDYSMIFFPGGYYYQCLFLISCIPGMGIFSKIQTFKELEGVVIPKKTLSVKPEVTIY